MTMRIIAVLLLFATSAAVAAPVPKELRRPGLLGAWEVTSYSHNETTFTATSNGQPWRFEPSGKFALTEPGVAAARLTGSYVMTPDGPDIRFSPAEPSPYKCAIAIEGDSLIVALTVRPDVRPLPIAAGSNRIVYTFQRVRE